MTDRPIIFSGPMIVALLDGRKTQTRRLIRDAVPDAPAMDNVHPKHSPRHSAPYLDSYCGERKTTANPRGMGPNWCWWTRDNRPGACFRVGYMPGDRLWVREAHAFVGGGDPGFLITRADYPESVPKGCENVPPEKDVLWRSSIHMPRAASRLTLIVTDVRVQRLQEISEDDAIAEGQGQYASSMKLCTAFEASRKGHYREGFRELWNSIHGAGAWDANAWVAAVTFSTKQRNIDALREAA